MGRSLLDPISPPQNRRSSGKVALCRDWVHTPQAVSASVRVGFCGWRYPLCSARIKEWAMLTIGR